MKKDLSVKKLHKMFACYSFAKQSQSSLFSLLHSKTGELPGKRQKSMLSECQKS